jgi:hypothetical protein
MQLDRISVRPIVQPEEEKYLELMASGHYLGAIRRIGESIWYVASYEGQWIALISFSAAVLQCEARDHWIGWHYRHQTGRLKLLANNSRFLLFLPRQVNNLGSRLLSLCLKRLSNDWMVKYAHPILLVETFVDPERFHGGVYRASNWQLVGHTKGYRRITGGYLPQTHSQQLVFVKPLHCHAQRVLSHPILSQHFNLGEITMRISTTQMCSLPDFFKGINDPRRTQGWRHRLPTVLGIAAAAVLCGMRSYESIAEWADGLSQKNRAHFRCRYSKGRYLVPSRSIIRNLLARVEPTELDEAFRRWNKAYAQDDQSLAIDGKVIDASGRQTQIMSTLGHHTGICYAQKK